MATFKPPRGDVTDIEMEFERLRTVGMTFGEPFSARRGSRQIDLWT